MSGRKNYSTDWRPDRRREPAGPPRRRRSAARSRSWADAPWRAASGLLLLTGLVSLAVTGEPPERTPRGDPAGVVWAVDRSSRLSGGAAATEARRSFMMDTQDSSGATRDRPWDPVAAPVAAPASSGSPDSGSLRSSAEGRSEWSLGRFVQEIEALIQRYPWPTIFLGMGAGFLLARRMR